MNRTKDGMINVAQVGCGHWGRNLIRVMSNLEGAQVSLVIDKSPQAQDYVHKSYPGVRVEPNDECLFNNPAIDAVVVATPASDHYRAARLALMADKHVFVETPLALSAEDAQVLVSLAQARELSLMAGHTLVYSPAVREAKELIDSGSLGDIHCIYSRRLNLGKARGDVNVLWDLASHDVSVINYWTGTEPIQCGAVGAGFLQPHLEAVAFLNMTFQAGLIANVHLSWLAPHRVREMTVVGSEKILVFDDVSSDAKLTIFDMGIDANNTGSEGSPYDSLGELSLTHRHGDTIIPSISYSAPLIEEMKHFVHCIRTGEKPLTGGDHAVGVVSVLEQADKSLKSQRLDMSVTDQRYSLDGLVRESLST